MRILELHASCFRVPWRREHEVMAWGFGSRVDVRTGPLPLTLAELLGRLPGGWTPDLIVLGEDGPLLRVLGLEDAPCPTVMLALDHRGHLAWQAQLARAIDLVCVGRRDALSAFLGAPAGWLPPWAPDGLPEPAGERGSPVVVVGAPVSEDPRGLLAELARRAPVRFAEGPSAALFGQTRIVVRHPAAGPLDARTLQAMACGALLVCERASDGLLELFEDGRELVLTPRGDTQALVAAVCRFLDDELARAETAERGRSAVRTQHLRSHRAAEVLARAASAAPRAPTPVRTGAAARAYCQLGEHARLLPVDSPYAVPPETYFSAAARLALAGDMLEPDRRAVFGRIALAAGDLSQAIRHLEWAVAEGGQLEDHLLRIETLVRAGESHRARAAAETLRAAHPDDPSAAAALARLTVPARRGSARAPTPGIPTPVSAARGALDRVMRNVRETALAVLGRGLGIDGEWWPARVPAAPGDAASLLATIPAGGRGLDLGAGEAGHADAIRVRAEAGPGVQVVAAGGLLPFADASVDFVWSGFHLARVTDPQRAAAEVVRVLKPGGRAVITVPFLQNASGGVSDYYRFTPDGLAVLFDGLEPVASGTSAGPSALLGDLMRSYATAFPAESARGRLGVVLGAVVDGCLLPLRWLDRALADRPGFDRWAQALYLVAEKPLVTYL